ncbi:MAG: LD-carboxypeptidase, partial [Bryobacteraceae bacterium]
MIARRSFLAACGAGLTALAARAAADEAPVRPAALRAGDTVGLITPGTYVSDPDRLALAVRTVEYFGLRPRMGRNVGKRIGYLGGSDEERLADLHAMFRDPEVKAVFSIRGGYGSEHLLDRIDYDLLRRRPKVFLGYSD